MHEAICVVDPLKLLQSSSDVLVEVFEVLLEKELFLVADQVHNVVVVSYDKHHIFLKKAQALAAIMHFH